MRPRAVLATVVLFGIVAGFVDPAGAADPPTDPRLADLMNSSCLPAAKTAPEEPPPVPGRLPAHVIAFQSSDQGEPSPSPAASAPTAVPSPSPSPLKPPPPGPGELLPPTPTPSPQTTPPPLPTPTGGGSAAPVYLVRPTGTPPSLPAAGSSASPNPGPTATGATPLPTLRPYDIVIMADDLHVFNRPHEPGDATGNVHVFYIEGQIVGDKAHFDGEHTIVLTGHTYLINRNSDSILYADSISFDTIAKQATLVNGRGESTAGVAKGKIHYTAEKLTAYSNGISHGDRGSFTTCENPHGGYHVEASSMDVTPGDKLIARKAIVFLGPLAVFYLPFLIIPLRTVRDPRRQTNFLPLIGYSQIEGFYVKARLGFAPSDYYYGYYRVDYATKRGLGLGYDAAIGTKNGRRALTIDLYTINDRIQDARETNAQIQETENFSKTVRGQFGATYTGDFGPGLSLPASVDITGTIVRQGNAGSDTLTFSQFKQGTLQNTFDLGLVDTMRLSQYLQQQFNVSLSRNSSDLSTSGSLHLNSDTHWTTHSLDFDFIYDKTDYTSDAFGYDKVPELQVTPHFDWKGFPFPPEMQLTVGEYTEPQNAFSTGRMEFVFNEPVFLKLGESDFSANYNVRQDYYLTGDEKAYVQQDAAFSTPIGDHIVNSITYNESHPIGPLDVPFQLLDQLSGGSKGAQDVIRIFNRDIYSLSLSTGTSFDRQAQPIEYQLNYRPSPRSWLVLGGFWTPGPGNGFGTTNVQAITPFGRDTTLQFSTNINWKSKGQLADKNVLLSKIIGDCYRIDASYNQDFRSFNLNFVILAFPGQGGGFGLGGGGTSPILPQSFGGF